MDRYIEDYLEFIIGGWLYI